MKLYTPVQNILLLIFRIVLGGGMIYGHGLRKIERVFGPRPVEFGDPIGIGSEPSLYLIVFAEVVCSSLIIIGLFTRLATIPLIIAMGVVVFTVQWGKEFGDMEVPLLYLVGFFILLAFGAGRYSIDQYRRKAW